MFRSSFLCILVTTVHVHVGFIKRPLDARICVILTKHFLLTEAVAAKRDRTSFYGAQSAAAVRSLSNVSHGRIISLQKKNII